MAGTKTAAQPELNQRIGTFIVNSAGGEPVRSLLPPPLPPIPALRMDGMLKLLSRTTEALGRLDGMATILPNPHLFVYTYVRKEAVLSAQIEGTQSTLSELLVFENEEAPGVPNADVTEVSNYVAALTHGLERIRGGFPISLRLIREIHSILLRQGRGGEKEPGEFRRSQNWIGGTPPGNALFVPPPPDRLMECLDPFEKFLHADDDFPALIKAGLAHVQFETIHPFLDGNGRLGRLLITLLLCSSQALREPTLYLSLYLKKHRQTYYDLLTRVREKGDWEAWIRFFLEGVLDTSEQATKTAGRILRLLEKDRKRIGSKTRSAATMLRLHQTLQTTPVMTLASAAKNMGVSFPTASLAAERLVGLGILREATGRARGKIYLYDAYVNIMNEDTEPLKL